MAALSEFERVLINRLQGGFPVAGRPYSRVAARLDTDEVTLISTIRRLLEDGRVSRFGPLYNAERLGGGLLLAAMAVPEAKFDRVAETVSAFPEVAHNYRRDHRLNLWPVIATETPAAVPATVARIEAATGLPVYAFPKEREFYLGLWLVLDADGGRRTRSVDEVPAEPNHRLDALDRRIVALTQAGLPLTPEPWDAVAEQIGCAGAEVVQRVRSMLAAGVIRRVGLVPNHYRLGLRGNGMTVWDVPDERLASVGERIGALDWVSHCYARPRHRPHWPYNLFAMVHGRDREEVNAKVGQMVRLMDGDSLGHETLFSTAVLKKAGLRLA